MIKVSGDVWVGNVYYRSKITSSTGIISQSIHSITQRLPIIVKQTDKHLRASLCLYLFNMVNNRGNNTCLIDRVSITVKARVLLVFKMCEQHAENKNRCRVTKHQNRRFIL